MANSSIQITPGTGESVDTVTLDDGDKRQTVVIGDPSTAAAVAPVDATNGLAVQVKTIAAGDNNIGNVDVVTLPALPAGTNVIGHVIADTGSTTAVTQATGTNLHTVVDSGTITTVSSVSAVIPGTSATNLGKAEDAAHSSGDTGVMALGVRNDAGTALAGTTGDYIPLTTNSAGALWVAGGGGTQYAEDAAHTSGDTGTLGLSVRRDANTSLVSTDGDYAPLQVTDTGSLKVAITSGAGSGGTSIADAASFTVASTSITPVGGIYEASPTALADGKVGILEVDSSRNLLVHEQYAPAAEDNTNQVIAQQIRPVAGSTYSPSSFGIFGTDVDLAAKGSAGNLFSIYATNINAAVRYLQVHNKATAPASSNVPILSLPIPAGTATVPGSLKLGRDIFGEGGLYLSTGVAIGISTTEATFTAATTTDHDYFGQYI